MPLTDDLPNFLRHSWMLEGLTPRQQEVLRLQIEEGYRLRKIDPGWFSLLGRREEWDCAIVLDACRFDAFARVNRLSGKLERRISPASCTEDWIAANLDEDLGDMLSPLGILEQSAQDMPTNIAGMAPGVANPLPFNRQSAIGNRQLPDVVYISASPYVSRWYLEQSGFAVPFLHLEEVWRDGWDGELHTVPPEALWAAYRRLREQMPGKKFVLHFMQPHQPFIGKVRVEGAGWRQFFGAMELDVPQLAGLTPIEMLEAGKVDAATVTAAYESNLELVLDSVRDHLQDLPPRTVITADHGEAFGECGIFGHPPGLLLPELIQVPYLVLDTSEPRP